MKNLCFIPFSSSFASKVSFSDLFVLALEFVLERYLLDIGLDGGDWRLVAWIFMIVRLINSHPKDTTGNGRVLG